MYITRSPRVLAITLLMAACSSTPSTMTSSSSITDAGTCAADQHTGADGLCDTTITWSTGPSIGLARDHHATFLVDPGPSASRFLYVAGGYSQTLGMPLKSVVRAPVADDGSLGAWETVADLPQGVSGAGVVVTHGVVVLAGGFESNATWVAKIASDGSLGSWTHDPALGGVRFHTSAVAFGDFVYVVGGLEDTKTTDEIARAPIDTSGTLGAFRVVAHLPYSLSHHSAVVDGSTLFVVGGQTGNTNDNSGTPHKEVQAASLGDDGSVGEWSQTAALPRAYETHASVVHDGMLFVIGGIVDTMTDESSGKPTSDVLRARIAGPLTVDAWAADAASALPEPRSHVHQAVVFGDHLFHVSGMDGSLGDRADTRVGTFQ